MIEINSKLNAYIQNHTSPEDDLLRHLVRETHLKMIHPRMLSGHIQGQFLTFLIALLSPKCVFEIGTFTGYSALCIAKALPSDGVLHTVEQNDEVLELAQTFFNQSAHKNQIKAYHGSALEIIKQIETPIDLVFIDGDKREYSAYYHAVWDKVKPGGFILADNVLWDGKVIQDIHPNDKHTLEICAFNQMVRQDNRVENVLLPLRDGIMLIRKKNNN